MSNKGVLKPHITEKTIKDTKKDKYTFVVGRNSKKSEIKNYLKSTFGVEVLSVNIMKNSSEVKRNKKRGYYTKAGLKKSVVTLKKGQKIDLFETEGKE